ncbi:cytohesin-1 isoform X4 [Hyalella azteca]|uniref:Cytohesin-1 isoform X4 n=1 Tax=Hyalella azteca TaxID=294128 RepID=A0A8B7NM66_HYAAZ|nr:cytohesin-1 isoform X4 [Hyalella azteca]
MVTTSLAMATTSGRGQGVPNGRPPRPATSKSRKISAPVALQATTSPSENSSSGSISDCVSPSISKIRKASKANVNILVNGETVSSSSDSWSPTSGSMGSYASLTSLKSSDDRQSHVHSSSFLSGLLTLGRRRKKSRSKIEGLFSPSKSRSTSPKNDSAVKSSSLWSLKCGSAVVFKLDSKLSSRSSTGIENVCVSNSEQLKDEMADVTAEMETLEGGDDGKNNPKSKQMSIGRKKFNMDPKKGIEYLIDHGLLKNTPDDISKFLYNGEGLNKTAIGDYLGERHDFNQTVLDSFVALHNFTDLILVQALRQFLWSFRLPGEAQKIDRMMERFARHYCDLNPTIFKHPDTCFVLSFAIIMLNTSLHNPAVKDKQTLEQFINMNRGIDNGDDLPRELLESLYESIKTEPFKIPEDDGNDLMHTFFNPDREGWLWKQGGRYKSWKRRWFILNDNCLYYFEFTTDKEPRGIIPLENIEVREVHDRNKPHCFELYATSTDFIKACKTDSEGKVVEGKHTVYRMSAATHDEKEEWIKCIRQSISHNPFYDLLAKRKKNIQKNNS